MAAAVRRGVRQLSGGRHEVPSTMDAGRRRRGPKAQVQLGLLGILLKFWSPRSNRARVARATAAVIDGWQRLTKLRYIELGTELLACDIPHQRVIACIEWGRE